MMTAPMHLGPFVLDSLLGEGGMGAVWSATHSKRKLPVAIKILSASPDDDRLVTAFQNEIRAVARLKHPHIITLFDYGLIPEALAEESEGTFHAGSPYLVMEYLGGGSLATRPAPESWDEVRNILTGILGGLGHAHARGVLHRDIGLNNVMWGAPTDSRPGLKLIDFGLVRDRDMGGELGAGFSAGTVGFAAPEQLMPSHELEQGPWSDLFAVGSVAFCLGTGATAFEGETIEEVVAACKSRNRRPLHPKFELPARFEAWIDQLLAYNPAHRFQCVADASAALVQLDQSERVEFSLPSLPDSWKVPEGDSPAVDWDEAGMSLFGLRRPLLWGRIEERDAIWNALSQVNEWATPQAVVLRGAAGTGKSRLVEWMAQRADELGVATVLKGLHSPVEGSLEGLPGMLAHQFKCVGIPWSQALIRLQKLLWKQGLRESNDILSVAELIRPAVNASPSNRGKRLHFDSPTERYEAMLRLLAQMSAQRLVVVWLDDVQWGADSLRFVNYALSHPATTPAKVLFILTARDEALVADSEEHDLMELVQAHESTTSMVVSPLTREGIHSVVTSLLNLAPKLCEEIGERSDGNPLFALQLVGDWVERGVLELGESHYQLHPEVSLAVPDSIVEIWTNRIHTVLHSLGREAAEAELQRALELAACLGQELELDEWNAVCDAQGIQGHEGLLDKLFKSGLAQPTDGGWCFEHPLLRESLERQADDNGRREEHHRACAHVLEERQSEQDHQSLHRIATHYLHGEEYVPAVGLLLEAVDSSVACGEFQRADLFLTERDQALDAMNISDNDEQRIDGILSRVHRLCTQTKDLPEALRLAQEAEQLASAQSLVRQEANALHYQGVIADHNGEPEKAVQFYERAFDRFQNDGTPQDIAQSYYVRGRSHYYLGNHDEAVALCQKATALYFEADDVFGAARCSDVLAKVYRARGQMDDAIGVTEKARDDFERLGYRTWEALAWTTLGEIKRLSQEWDEANACYDHSIELWGQTGSNKVFYPRLNQAYVRLAQREFASSQLELNELMALAEPWDLAWTIPGLHLGLLGCAAGLGQWDEWDIHFEQARKQILESGTVLDEYADLCEYAGQLAKAQGQPERHRAAYDFAIEQWTGIKNEARAQALRDELNED